jgi:hypothetical protein
LNADSVVLCSFAATAVQSGMEAAAQWRGYSRMSLPFLIGTIFTPDRDRASVIGILVHMLNGCAVGAVYAAILQRAAATTWWGGAMLGALHGMFVLLVLLPLLPGLHPRMANEHAGPEPGRTLEPPGFLALHYGRWTPTIVMLSHLAYGAVFGWLAR